MIYQFDNHKFLVPDNDLKRSQTIKLSNGIVFIRGSKIEGVHYVYLPKAKSEESFFMDRFEFRTDGTFIIFKDSNSLITAFNKGK